jgi:hypothetical protein
MTNVRATPSTPKCCCGHLHSGHDGLPTRCPHPGCGHRRVVHLDPTAPCLLHDGAADKDGYGRVSGTTAHQRAFEEQVRDLQPGETLDHICETRLCTQIRHLEPVTQAVNSQRRWGQPRA